tara:strand:- start:276 stop:1469 length:1194 start_codon:yes stop_codon:yes gene_type:complete
MKIKEVISRVILNSKTQQAIEVEVKTVESLKFKASIGAGTSSGKHEVNSYPKQGPQFTSDYFNKHIANKFKGISIDKFDDLEKVEREFQAHDFSEDLKKLGGNIIVSTELAMLKALGEGELYKTLGKPKPPLPLCNIVGGGKHSSLDSPDIQEFLVLPRTKNIEEAVFSAVTVYNRMEKELIKRNFNGRKTIEGAFCPDMNNIEILNILNKVVEKTSKENKVEIKIGLDMAASSLYNGKNYEYKRFAKFKQKKIMDKEEQINFVEKLIKNYDLVYVEDPLEEDDFDGFEQLNKKTCLITGDDLTTTNPLRIKEAIGKISSVIIKPNQIGSLLKVKESIELAKKNKIIPVISHRSGETEDNSLTHLATGFNCPIIKTGINGLAVTKLNELLRINKSLG